MKKRFLSILATLALGASVVACGPNAETVAAQSTSDSLEMVVAQKDSILNDAFSSIEEIATSLNQIAERQNIVVATSASPEINKTQKAQIVDNLAAISNLLDKNRDAVKKLNATAKKLKAANVKIEALESLVASLEKQIQSKDVQIGDLIKQIEGLNIAVADLRARASELEGDKEQLESTVKDQDVEMNTVYFIVGTDKSLMAKNVIDKKGFIGRTRTVKNTSDMTDFTRGDLRQLDRIKIGAKGVNVVSAHPEGSYTLVEGAKKVVDEIVINDPKEFWRNTKILIISHK